MSFRAIHTPHGDPAYGPEDHDRDALHMPHCGTVSHNPHDAEHRYCARCHMFVDEPTVSTKWRRYSEGGTIIARDVMAAVAQTRRVILSQNLRQDDLFCILPPLPTKTEAHHGSQNKRTNDDGHH